jgi:hypothetical protein
MEIANRAFALRREIDCATRTRPRSRKLVKRQMFGRGKLDLLQARVIGAA